MTKLASSLLINRLELRVHLGWPDIERQQEQTVFLDIDIKFSMLPSACVTDHLDDTLCYSTLINEIRTNISTRKFHLIEHLTCEIYKIIKPLLPHQSTVNVRITKHPDIPGLSGGVQFSYWDNV